MSADLELQRVLRARFIADPAVIALVPATHILDVNQRPAPVPSIILGESQVVDEGTSMDRTHHRIWHTMHVWRREASLTGSKAICGAVARALYGWRPALAHGLHCADLRVSSTRYLRDPDGDHSHGVITVEALIVEVAT